MNNKVSAYSKIVCSRIFNITLLCLFVLCAGIYNYGLHRSFWFDYEYSFPIYRRFLAELYGLNINFSGFYDVTAYVPYHLFGCSLKALRVYASAIYQLIIFFCTIAAIYSFERKQFEWYKLGIFAFIAVILHPGSSPYCGDYSTLFHQYPYDMHSAPVVFATLSIMLLCIHQGITERKYKYVLKALIFIVMAVGYKKVDFLYIIGFIGPLMCVGLIYIWKEHRELFIALVFGVMALLAILHVISFAVPSLASMFAYPSIGYGTWEDGSTIYGNNGFADLREIWGYISTTTTEFLALFNIDISGKSMLSIGTLLAGFRLILVIFMLVCCFKNVINAIKKDDGYKSLDPVNIVLALGILFNLFLVMFSDYGNGARCIRHMTLTLFYGAIFLSRQSENIIGWLYGKVDNRRKLYFFLFFSLAIIVNMQPFWKVDDYVADYEPAFLNVSRFITENNLGNGIGGHGYASTLTLLGEGDYAVVDAYFTDDGIAYDVGCNVPGTYYYIVDWQDRWRHFDAEEVYQRFGEPTAVYEIDGFVLYYYLEGFDI